MHDDIGPSLASLGLSLDTAVAGILDELRPQLPGSLRNLPDDRLLALVNWSIMAAWEKTIAKLYVGKGSR